MTGFRVSISLFRKVHVFIRPWERRSTRTLCVSRTQCMLPADIHTRAAYYGTYAKGAFSITPSGGLRLHLERNLALSVRLKSNKTSKKNRKQTLQEEDDDDEDDDLDQRDFEDEFEEDPNLPKDYKDLVKSVQSFRYDVVMKAGLDIARNKVEDAFYANQLRLNGEKLWKKSRAVKVGDTLDLILDQDKEAEAETVTVMRVVLKNVAEEKTGTDKYKVLLRRWKNLKLPKEDVLK